MKRVILTEAEIKVAIRDYIQKNEVYDIKFPWGMMELRIEAFSDEEHRLKQAFVIYSEE